MTIPDWPTPGITPGTAAASYQWAVDVNAAGEARYQDTLARLAVLLADVNTRQQTLAYAQDTANTAVALGAGVFTALQPTFSIPPTTQPVLLRWGGGILITAAGAGSVTIGPADVTAGIAPSTGLPGNAGPTGSLLAGTFSKTIPFNGEQDVGASATWRVFRLYGFVGRDAASSLAASQAASGASPFGFKTWMRAVLV